MSTALAVPDKLQTKLAAITTVGEAKELRAQADALRLYARKIGAGLVEQNRCTYVRIQAERKAGELLKQTDRQAGKRTGGTLLQAVTRSAGIDRVTALRWQTMAELPQADLDRIVRHVAAKEELTSAMILNAARTYVAERQLAQEQPPVFAEPREALLGLGLLEEQDFDGLLAPAVRTLIDEVHAAYRDLCAECQPPEGPMHLRPPIYSLTNRQGLRLLVQETVRKLKAGEIGHAGIRSSLRDLRRKPVPGIHRQPQMHRARPLTDYVADGSMPGWEVTLRDPAEQYVGAARDFVQSTDDVLAWAQLPAQQLSPAQLQALREAIALVQGALLQWGELVAAGKW